MRKILFLLFLNSSLMGLAQEIPSMKGKKLSEVIGYFDGHSMMYSQEKNTEKNEIILRALVEQTFSKDSTKEINKLLFLKFNAQEVCTYNKYEYESNKIIRTVKTKEPLNSGKILVQAGKRGILANGFTFLGTGLTVGGVLGDNTGITILGGAFTLTGIILNMTIWQKVKQSGEQMEIERIQMEKRAKPILPQMNNPHQKGNVDFYIK